MKHTAHTVMLLAALLLLACDSTGGGTTMQQDEPDGVPDVNEAQDVVTGLPSDTSVTPSTDSARLDDVAFQDSDDATEGVDVEVVQGCEDVTCDAPPAASCEGPELTTYGAPGTCEGGACTYAPTVTDCMDAGQMCEDGACVEPATVCEAYCIAVAGNCTDWNAISWGVDCATDCATWPQGETTSVTGDTAYCRLYHATLAADDAETHCPHASPDGGGVCVDDESQDLGDGACTNTHDVMIWDQIGASELLSVTNDLAFDCISEPFGEVYIACVQQALMAQTNLSGDCATCYAEHSNCGLENCLVECLTGGGACEVCLQEVGCDSALWSCTGDMNAALAAISSL